MPSVPQEYARTLLVVGGGVTGLTAAREAAQAGYPVLLVEKTGPARRLGGEMVGPHAASSALSGCRKPTTRPS